MKNISIIAAPDHFEQHLQQRLKPRYDGTVTPSVGEQQSLLPQRDATTPAAGAGLACRSCGHWITEPGCRAEVAGQHIHSLVNPFGFRYRVGCFDDAQGVSVAGPASSRWSWFAGYRWQVADCASCGVHLGWRYSGGDGVGLVAIFFGLILDRLVEQRRSLH